MAARTFSQMLPSLLLLGGLAWLELFASGDTGRARELAEQGARILEAIEEKLDLGKLHEAGAKRGD